MSENEVLDDGKPAEGDPPKDGGVSFTAEQQEFVNRLVDERYKKAFSKAESKYSGEMVALRKELEELKAAKPADSSVDVEKIVSERVAAAREALVNELRERDLLRDGKSEEFAVMLQQIKTASTRSILETTLARFNCVPAAIGDAADLLERQVVFQENTYYLQVPANDGDGVNLVPLAQGVASWLSSKPHYRKFTGTGGTGSQDGGAGCKKLLLNMTPEEINNLSDEEFAKMDREQLLRKKQNIWQKR